MAARCLCISRPRSAVNWIGSNCSSSRSRRWKPSGTQCLPPNKSPHQNQRRCCSPSKGSVRSLPPCSGRKGYSGTSTIGVKSLLMRGWRRRPGRADRSIVNKAFLKPEIRDCEPPSYNSPGYGCAISRSRHWPCGSKNGSDATAAASRRRPSALARKLLVALWKYVTAGVIIEGAVIMAA